MKKKSGGKLSKSAVTGRFVSKEEAQRNPRETYQTRRRPQKKAK